MIFPYVLILFNFKGIFCSFHPLTTRQYPVHRFSQLLEFLGHP